MSSAAPIPEVGQLVDVRYRRFLVTDVTRSALPADPLALRPSAAHHLVTLASVEDDMLGEEMQVIWEAEVAPVVHETLALPVPDGFDTPARLDAFLSAVQWGAIASASETKLQSPFRSGIEIEEYQLAPVVRALQMVRVNLLIADDVGLGKTIEAGLVAQELLIRHRARRMLIVCPSALQQQWRDQMRAKFGLDFRIVDSELMRRLRRSRGLHVNPWTHFPRLITSMDYLKRDHPLRLFREALPAHGEVSYPRRFDLLIVDEAHNIAPSGVGKYAVDSHRTAAVRIIAPHFEHRLFLTATPHNGYPESFAALLELLDPQRFARGIPPGRQQLAQVMVRRLKSELVTWDGTPRFPPRTLHPLEVAYSDAEQAAHVALQEYTRLRQQHFSDTVERTATEFVLKLLKKRLLSSPAAFQRTLHKHQQSLTTATRGTPGQRPHRPKEGILRAMLDDVTENYGNDEAYEHETDDAVATTTALFAPPTAAEQTLLQQMQQWADEAARRPDSKARTLIAWLHTTLRPAGVWNSERVIIFTEYRATQQWLQTLLAAEGITNDDRLLVLYGGMDDDQREYIKAAFQADPADSPVRVLLATDAASEGIDLQRHCHRLIHYEIPWNPNRMEQRNGRIDRHGQQHPPTIYHFAPHGYATRTVDTAAPVGKLAGDLEFLMRAVNKVEAIRQDLGKVGPVIADQVTEAMLGKRARLETDAAERDAAPLRQMLKFERNLREQIEKLHERLHESRRELDLTPANLLAVVQVGLELAGQPPLGATATPGVFHLPQLKGSWSDAAEGLTHPYTGDVRPITFDHALARGRDDVVLIHLNHRLMQLALRLLRAEVWGGSGAQKLHRVTARLIPDDMADAPVAIAHARLVVIGNNRYRLHEELIAAGGEINAGRFRRIPQVGRVRELLASASDTPPTPTVHAQLTGVWAAVAAPLEQALNVRMKDRLDGLRSALAEREQKEVSDTEAILAELEQAILRELRDPQSVQLKLFSPTEEAQYQRDVSALEARLANIPAEREQELAAIRARYADVQPRLFPVAVTFLVPARLNRG